MVNKGAQARKARRRVSMVGKARKARNLEDSQKGIQRGVILKPKSSFEKYYIFNINGTHHKISK